eukprot:CAMPEP_0179418208 /NCGR_PEP_ID=MMETSP0799-20121207/7836_1 /TAXON_ID=46947 /ORGANISM="Geminigera cryophila, Strain CCMP2564" /LENGTH=63 /DNA_ID=CAMNT_0021191385 /DNA_START=49 /DNA_END=240 /DNA_ORIENTATION=+
MDRVGTSAISDRSLSSLARCRRTGEWGMDASNASGKAAAPNPAAAKKPRKVPTLCEHRWQRTK